MKRSNEREGEAAPSPKDAYSTGSIQVLEGLEAVRKRPGMYLGNPQDGSALHHLVWELVGNAIDQHLAREARHLRVDLEGEWVTVEDDGPGIPVDRVPWHGRSALEVVFTTLHAGATWDGHLPHVHVSAGSRGVGVAAVNAVCERVEVDTHRDGRAWHMAFERGRVVTPLTDRGPSSRRGARVRLRPDASMFTGVQTMDPSVLETRLRELAWLNPLLAITWRGAMLPGQGGIGRWARAIAGPVEADCVVSASRILEEAAVEVAFAWRAGSSAPPEIHSFVAQCSSRDGGTHVHGLWSGLSFGVAALAPGLASEARRELLAPGLVAIVNVGLYAPQFGSPTRDRLMSPVARTATKRVVEDALERALPEHTFDHPGSLAFHLRSRFALHG